MSLIAAFNSLIFSSTQTAIAEKCISMLKVHLNQSFLCFQIKVEATRNTNFIRILTYLGMCGKQLLVGFLWFCGRDDDIRRDPGLMTYQMPFCITYINCKRKRQSSSMF